jgi:hypothetical protein
LSGHFRAGVGRSTINPPVGIAHAGWGAQVHERAEGIEDDFFATALALADGDSMALVIELDTGLLMTSDATAFREAVAAAVAVDVASIRLSYSHTHAGPLLHVLNIDAGGELVEADWQTMRSGTVGAARAAVGDLQPARVGARFVESHIAVNRRFATPDGRVVVSPRPDGFTDPIVTVGRIDAIDGSAIAAIVGYACHPITLGFQNKLLSPDFPGPVRRRVEELTGATCLFLQGAAGDQMPVEALTDDPAVHRRLGTMLGATAAAAFLGIDTLERSWSFDRVVESGAPLGMSRSTSAASTEIDLRVVSARVSLPLRDAADENLATATRDELRAELEGYRAVSADDEVIRDAMYRLKRAEMRVWFATMYGDSAVADVELHGLRVGPLALLGFPGEPFASTGVAVRERSPFPVTFFGGYTNGWSGYVPTRDEFPRGGYEVEWGSHYGPGAAEALEAASADVLRALS